MTITPPRGRVSPLDAIGEEIAISRSRDVSQALKGSCLDFDVDMVPHLNPVTGKPELGSNGKPKFFDVIRTDTNRVLGVVMGKYKPLLNSLVFGTIVPTFIENGARIRRCHTLEDGARCFMSLEWDNRHNLNVLGDIVGCRGIILTSHDGRWSTKMWLCPLRLACLNGLTLPMPGFTYEVMVTHTVHGEQRLIEAQEVFAQSSKYFATFGIVASMMAKTKINESKAIELLKSINGLKDETESQAARRHEIVDLFKGSQAGSDSTPVRGTAWGLLNALAEAVDYGSLNSRIRLTDGTTEAEQRFKRTFDNNGSAQKMRLSLFDRMLRDKDLGLGKQYQEMREKMQRRQNMPNLN